MSSNRSVAREIAVALLKGLVVELLKIVLSMVVS
jgi:hypothetical protein